MHFPTRRRSYAAESEIRASRVRQSDMWIYKSPPPRIATKDRRSLTCTHTRTHTRAHNADSANRDRTRQCVLRGFESLLRLDNASRIGNAKSACSLGYIYAHMYGSRYMFTRICTYARRTYTGWSARRHRLVSNYIIQQLWRDRSTGFSSLDNKCVIGATPPEVLPAIYIRNPPSCFLQTEAIRIPRMWREYGRNESRAGKAENQIGHPVPLIYVGSVI